MGVPDTDTFHLQDVVDVINAENPTVNTLQECFTNSTDVKFDPEYKLYKDRQSNFRNYGNQKSVIVRPYLIYTKDKTLQGEGVSWPNIRSCVNPYYLKAGNIETSVDYIGNYKIERGFLVFDLRNWHSGSTTVTDIELRTRKVSSSATDAWFNVYKMYWTEPLTGADSCKYTRDLLTGTRSGYTQGDSSYVYKLEGTSGEVTTFNTDCVNTKVYTGLIHGRDYANNAPGSGEYFYFIGYKGNNISQSLVWNNELRIKYWGFHMLNAYPDPIDFPKGYSGGARIFVTADTQNTWQASVTTGGAWLSINGTSGYTGSYKFEITVTENTIPNPPRSGEITVYSDAYLGNYVVNVEQEGTRLTASPDPWYADPVGDDQVITVEADSTNAWTASVTLGGAWLSIFKGGSGTGDGSFTLQADANGGSYRYGEVTIDHDGTNYIVNVEQASQ